MTKDQILGLVVAVVLHVLALFGVHVGSHPKPLPISDQSVEVNLVESLPQNEVVSEPAEELSTEEIPEPPPLVESVSQPIEEPIPEVKEPIKPSTLPLPEPIKERTPHVINKAIRPKPSSPVGARSSPHGSTTMAQPRYRNNPKPKYPEQSRRLRQAGQVLVDVEVSTEGQAVSVKLKRSSGFSLLDDAALEAVRRWTFEPARTAGMPMQSRVVVPVRFDLSQ